MNHNSCKLSKLCAKGCNQLYFSFFEAAEPLQPILSAFYTMNDECSNDFFLKAWTRHLKAVKKSDVPLTFEHVADKVWTPAFSYCKQLYSELKKRSMKLSDVNFHFGQYERAGLLYNLKYLVTGVSKCLGEHKAIEWIDGWLQETVTMIQDHWSVEKCGEVAYLFIQLKMNFGLTGNFTGLERLYSMVGELYIVFDAYGLLYCKYQVTSLQ